MFSIKTKAEWMPYSYSTSVKDSDQTTHRSKNVHCILY